MRAFVLGDSYISQRDALRLATSLGNDPMKCLCCDQDVNAPGSPITLERATRAVLVLAAVGWTKEKLLGDDRLDYQAPGLRTMLEDGTVIWPTPEEIIDLRARAAALEAK